MYDISSTVSTELEGRAWRAAHNKADDTNIIFIATRVIKRNKFLSRCLLYLLRFHGSSIVPFVRSLPLFAPNSGGAIEYCRNAHKYEIRFNRSLRLFLFPFSPSSRSNLRNFTNRNFYKQRRKSTRKNYIQSFSFVRIRFFLAYF